MHQFHIPVLGLGFSIDTPLKVARYGISSVVSIVDDELVERMREYHCRQQHLDYQPIDKHSDDSRARRITAYLNLLKRLVDEQFAALQQQEFFTGSDVDNYFELLPETDPLKQGYKLLNAHADGPLRQYSEQVFREAIKPGAIDVNIMAKIDKLNYDANGEYAGDQQTDALAALRGFANSDLESSVVLSAGLNQRLYGYMEQFTDFYPDKNGVPKKKIILKVSDYRSALVQAKLLAKKGLWVSEFRIESGLNCGGHAFATDGLLLGPILEEFKQKRGDLHTELFALYQKNLTDKGLNPFVIPQQRITVQGGIGTAAEHQFLCTYYGLDGTGWGSPFLLVPEATNVDDITLGNMANARKDDFYLSNASPLGILFNNFRKSSIERQRLERIALGRPGSPCTKKFMVNNTEFTAEPICTASRQYQALKIMQLTTSDLTDDEFQKQVDAVTEKICLCEGLCASAYIKNDMLKPRENPVVAICPGPNIAYFSGPYSLREMVGHIYGRIDLLYKVNRPHMFVNELRLYIDYLKKSVADSTATLTDKQVKYFQKFSSQLQDGIRYYQQLFSELHFAGIDLLDKMAEQLSGDERLLQVV